MQCNAMQSYPLTHPINTPSLTPSDIYYQHTLLTLSFINTRYQQARFLGTLTKQNTGRIYYHSVSHVLATHLLTHSLTHQSHQHTISTGTFFGNPNKAKHGTDLQRIERGITPMSDGFTISYKDLEIRQVSQCLALSCHTPSPTSNNTPSCNTPCTTPCNTPAHT